MKIKHLLTAVAALFWCAGIVLGSNEAASGENGGYGSSSTMLAGIALMLLIGKLGGEVCERFQLPAVLGELMAGVLLGNLVLLGFTGAEPLKTDTTIAALAEIGVIILLFEVGLESDLKEMTSVGWSSLLVAVVGVVAPFFLGWMVAAYFLSEESRLVHIFIGATLCATSVGITARVFKDLGKLNTREARIILGAAVIDDVFGLVILAVVAGYIRAAANGGVLSLFDVSAIALKAVLFLVAAIIAGRLLLPFLLRSAARLEVRGVLLTFAITFCFLLSWAAFKVGLAPIVGAFAAGLMLDEVHYTSNSSRKETSLLNLLQPLATFLVPIFFVLMGLKVDLRFFARKESLVFAAALTIAAILGKQVCAFGVVERGINRTAIGLGMIPRGEVGLIFAGIGAALTLPSTTGTNEVVINSATFGAIVIMVMVTTLVTPFALKWALGKRQD